VPPDPILFGTDGWRGRIARELTFESAMRVVDAVGSWTADPANPDPGDPSALVLVHDTRFLSPELATEAARRLARVGFQVALTSRPAPTPCASWHVVDRGLRAGIAITASHNPPEWNGVKVKAHFGGSAPPETYAAVARAADRPLPERDGGGVKVEDLLTPYREALASRVDLDAIRRAGLRVLFDALHGAAGTLLEEIVGDGSATSVTTIRGARDPMFGGVAPEPIPLNLGASRDALRSERFDLVLASDGDGDRLGVLSSKGEFVTPHRVLALLAESLAKRRRVYGAIAKTFSTSLLVDRVAASLGVPLVVTPIGFKHIAERMRTGEVGIGGEESGGLGVSFFLPERDGVLSALLVLEAVAVSGVSLEALLAEQDTRFGAFAYDRRDIHMPAAHLRSFVAGLKDAPPPSVAGETVTDVADLDGVKLVFGERGWLLHRLSGTEPVIRIYAEHEDPARVGALLDETERRLRA
jgi:phosphomannomutase